RGHNGDKEEGEFVVLQNQDINDTDVDANESTCSGHFKKSNGPRTGGSIIQLIKDLVNDSDVANMGDFNEVQDSSERFGLVFNKHGAKLFNDFIVKASLTEVPLGEDSWNKIHVVDNNAYVRFMKKLKLLKERIKAWSSSYRELVNYRKNTLKTELTNLDLVLDIGEGINTDVTKRSDVVRILQDIKKTEAIERFEKPNLSGIQFDREFLNKICFEQAVDLEREVSKEEVKRAVWDCGIDKAPGPDGFTFRFYRHFWNLIECDVIKAVKWFFLHERILSGGNSSFITLIPKVSNANVVKDFRPISLIGSVYKIVAKILANHLVLVLGNLVSDTQSTFLKERQFLDGPFILNKNQSNIDTIVRVLKVFYSASGLRINIKKSKLMRIAVDASRVEQNDAWRGDVAFKILTPRIYMLESMKDIQVATKLLHVDLEWSFRRKSRGGAEHIQMTILKEIIEGCILCDMKDRWTWSLEGSGEFLVSSIRKTIDAAFLPCGNVKTRWVKEVPIKINILAWKVSNDYFPTRFNLSRRGMDIGSIVCLMCNNMVESSRHLFFSFDLSNQLMSKISRWWDLRYQEINSYEEWTDWILSIRLSYNLKKVFEGVCYIVWWFIWDWRNQAIFGPGFRAKSMMFDDIVSRSNSASFKTRLRFVSRRRCVLSQKTPCVLLQDTRPPMLDRTDFASWQQRIRLYCRGKDNGFGLERLRVYSDLSNEEKDRYNADIRATNIMLQGLPKDIFTLINHYTDAKDIWDNVKMLLEGSELTKEDRESQLFSKLINDMRNIKMTMSRLQLNSKFVNNMLHEWGRFVTAVKLNRGLRDSNYDQLFAYLKQHETHAKENKMILERLSQPTVDPLALLSKVSNPQH
nr:RNA-directed DNA polymerase, eukaryota [Tanacetum cinerariifolium]